MSDEFIVRTSERTDFTRCRQRWQWGYQDRLKPIRTAPALRFGDLVHQGLAAWYKPTKSGTKRGVKPWIAFDRAYQAQLDQNLADFNIRLEDDEQWVNARELGMAMLRNYVKEYGQDERYRVIAPEMPFQIDLYKANGLYICTYVGQLDVVVEDLNTREIGLMEHKTAASIRTDHLNMDEQASSYWGIGSLYLKAEKIIPQTKDLDFILYNFLRKHDEDKRPRDADGYALNKDGSISKKQPPPLFERQRVYRGQVERDNLLRRVQYQVAVMKRVADGRSPVFKTILNGCSGMFGCQYREMCEVHECGGDWESVRDATMTTWEPYSAHELQEEKER